MAWTADEENHVKVGTETVETVEGEVTKEDIKSAARAKGLKKFNVYTEDDEQIEASSDLLPYNGDVKIVAVNRAGAR